MVVPSRLRPMVLVAAAVILGGAACSSPPAEPPAGKPDVATLRSPGAATPSASPSAAPKPPRERIDGTAEDFEALLKPYEKCMSRLGLDLKGQRASGKVKADDKITKEADKECQPLYPLPPWEMDPANPKYKDFARDVVKCLKGKGVQYVEVNPDGPGWALGGPQNDAKSISKGMDLSPACEREVAAKK
jgi:hypothetical protein